MDDQAAADWSALFTWIPLGNLTPLINWGKRLSPDSLRQVSLVAATSLKTIAKVMWWCRRATLRAHHALAKTLSMGLLPVLTCCHCSAGKQGDAILGQAAYGVRIFRAALSLESLHRRLDFGAAVGHPGRMVVLRCRPAASIIWR